MPTKSKRQATKSKRPVAKGEAAHPVGETGPAAAPRRVIDRSVMDSESIDVDRAGADVDRSAFLRDPQDGPARMSDEVAEQFAERYLSSATSGDDFDEEGLAEPADEEDGGPYLTTTAAEEMADGTDASNPAGAEPAPFPTTQSES